MSSASTFADRRFRALRRQGHGGGLSVDLPGRIRTPTRGSRTTRGSCVLRHAKRGAVFAPRAYCGRMRVEQAFRVARPAEAVFDYVTDASKLADWQTTKTSVEQLTDGPPAHRR